MERKELLKRVIKNLKKTLNKSGDPMCHRSYQAYREGGAIEAFLIVEGFLDPAVRFEYLTGGKKYIPLFGDFRWKESYPHLMLRKAEEYNLQQEKLNNESGQI